MQVESPLMTQLVKVVSGGQTGVDRAALDAARQAGIPLGGWCPKGRIAEDGIIPDQYPLQETPNSSYDVRTEWNVRDSDGTLILYERRLVGGTELTLFLARQYERHYYCVDLTANPDTTPVRKWILEGNLHVLNIAGPRESNQKGIYQRSFGYLFALFRSLETESRY